MMLVEILNAVLSRGFASSATLLSVWDRTLIRSGRNVTCQRLWLQANNPATVESSGADSSEVFCLPSLRVAVSDFQVFHELLSATFRSCRSVSGETCSLRHQHRSFAHVRRPTQFGVALERASALRGNPAGRRGRHPSSQRHRLRPGPHGCATSGLSFMSARPVGPAQVHVLLPAGHEGSSCCLRICLSSRSTR